MAITTSSSLSQQFVDKLSRELIVEPDPAYVFARLAGGARAGAMDIPEIMGRAGMASNLTSAMGAGLGTLDPLNERFMQIAPRVRRRRVGARHRSRKDDSHRSAALSRRPIHRGESAAHRGDAHQCDAAGSNHGTGAAHGR